MAISTNILQAFTPTAQSIQRQQSAQKSQANQTNNDSFAKTLNQKMNELSGKTQPKQESKPNKIQNTGKGDDKPQIGDVAPANPEDIVVELPNDNNASESTGKGDGEADTDQVSAEVIEVAITAQMLPLMEAFAKPEQTAAAAATAITEVTGVDTAKAPVQAQAPVVTTNTSTAAATEQTAGTVQSQAKPQQSQEAVQNGVLVAENAVVEPATDGAIALEGMDTLTQEGNNTVEINPTGTADKGTASQPAVEVKSSEVKPAGTEVKAEVITNTTVEKPQQTNANTASTVVSAMSLPKTNEDGMTVRVSAKEDLAKAEQDAQTAPVDMQAGDEPVVTKVKQGTGEMQSQTGNSDADDADDSNTGNALTAEHEAFTLQADRRIVTISDISAKINKLNSTPQPEVQLAEAIKTNLQSGKTEFEMQLAPISLGKITVKLVAENGIMSVELRADNPKTQALLMQNSGEIRDLIQNANQQTQVITPNQAENLPRNYQEGQRNNQQQQQQNQQQQAQEQEPDKATADFLTLLQQLKNQSTMMRM